MTGVYGTKKVMRSLANENPMTRKSRFALLTTGSESTYRIAFFDV